MRVLKISPNLGSLSLSCWNFRIEATFRVFPCPYPWPWKWWKRVCCLGSYFAVKNCSLSLICFHHKLCNFTCSFGKIIKPSFTIFLPSAFKNRWHWQAWLQSKSFKNIDSPCYFILRGGKHEFSVLVAIIVAIDRTPVNPYRHIPFHKITHV